MVLDLDINLLGSFKLCAESGKEWDGDSTNANLFRIWLSSLKKQMNEDNIDHVDFENASDDEEGEDDVADNGSTRTSKILNDVLQLEAENAKFFTDHNYTSSAGQTISFDPQKDILLNLDDNIVETYNFVAVEALDNIELGATATIVAEGEEIFDPQDIALDFHSDNIEAIEDNTVRLIENTSAPPSTECIVHQQGTSKGVFQILSEIRPVVMPQMKRAPTKKPSVISSSSNIKKKHDILAEKQRKMIEKENRKVARELLLAHKKANPKTSKRKRSDSFLVSQTPSSSAPSTPDAASRPRRSKKNLAKRALFSPSSSAPTTPNSTCSDFIIPESKKVSTKSGVRRPLFSSETESD